MATEDRRDGLAGVTLELGKDDTYYLHIEGNQIPLVPKTWLLIETGDHAGKVVRWDNDGYVQYGKTRRIPLESIGVGSMLTVLSEPDAADKKIAA